MVEAREDPYLFARWNGAALSVTGPPSCRLGHEIGRGDGQRPDGIFAGWRLDGDSIAVDNDRYGLFPLYYCSSPDTFAISPSIPKLISLGASGELDHDALAVFLTLGNFLGEDTPFRAIRALPPHVTLLWRPGQLTLKGGFRLPRPQVMERDSAIDGYLMLFREAMAKRARPPDDVVLPLSGGKDSRHILFELCRAERPPSFTVTVDPHPPMPREDKIAAAVSRALGVPHVRLRQPGTRLDAELRKNVLTSFCADEHAWYLQLADHLPGRALHVFDGLGGDILSAGFLLTRERLALFEAGRFSDLAARLLASADPRVDALLAEPDLIRRDVVVARIGAELTRHADAPNPVGSFFFWNRTRRKVALAPYRMLGRSVEVLSPYLDHDLYDHLASLPASLFLDHRFHAETIQRAFPRFAGLEYQGPARKRLAPVQSRRFARNLLAYAGTRSNTRLASRPAIAAGARRMALLGATKQFGWRQATLATWLLQLSS